MFTIIAFPFNRFGFFARPDSHFVILNKYRSFQAIRFGNVAGLLPIFSCFTAAQLRYIVEQRSLNLNRRDRTQSGAAGQTAPKLHGRERTSLPD
jgi:hypothetical protein